jgi:hypothetical protein
MRVLDATGVCDRPSEALGKLIAKVLAREIGGMYPLGQQHLRLAPGRVADDDDPWHG